MKKNYEEKVLEKLYELQDTLTGTLNQKRDFTVKTESSEGVSYTHDRENYLQLGLEVATEELQMLIDDIEERKDRKSQLRLVK